MDQYPIAASSLEKYYHINGKQFERQYKEHLSGYTDWEEKDHADKWLIFPENIGPRMSIDETSMSNGEVYTILSNKDAHCRDGAIAAIVYASTFPQAPALPLTIRGFSHLHKSVDL